MATADEMSYLLLLFVFCLGAVLIVAWGIDAEAVEQGNYIGA